VRNESALEGLTEKTADGFPAPLAIIQRPMVHIHPHKFVGKVAAHVAGILQRVLHRFRAMVETKLDARGERVGNLFARGELKFFVNDIAPERQRQAVIFAPPPNAKIPA
jgi:hypothetical protein